MTRNELKNIIDSKPYDFLRENEHLGKHMMYLTIGGSYAYGTNQEGSDVDIRGVTLNSKSDLIGISEFEHYVDKVTDTTVFSFNKAVKLMCSGNPNMLEQLGNADDLVISYHPTTKMLMENKSLFLSKKIFDSFGGFATKLGKESERISMDLHNRPSEVPTRTHLCKTMMNEARLYLMLFDIAEQGEIVTHREKDRKFLMDIRNGEYVHKNGRIKNLYQDIIRDFDKRFQYDKQNCSLTDKVDMKAVNELVMTINEESLKI